MAARHLGLLGHGDGGNNEGAMVLQAPTVVPSLQAVRVVGDLW